MKKNILLVSMILISALACTNERKSNPVCDLKTVQTMATSPSATGSFAHYILIKDMSRECMDSATMVRAAIQYYDTVKVGRPVDLLKFYSSDRYLIEGEMSQPIELEKDRLVGIMLDTSTKRPVKFWFVDKEDNPLYSGPLWKPHGIDAAKNR